jgi:hypothetical protein
MRLTHASFSIIAVAVGALCLSVTRAGAVDQGELGFYEGGDMPHGMSVDCVLQEFSACSGWIWLCGDDEGAVWGTVYDVEDCPGSCASGVSVSEIYLYTVCASTPARFGGVGIASVDGVDCLADPLYDSGPLTIVHCTPGDRWNIIETPPIPVNGRFAVTVTWGPRVDGISNPRFAVDAETADFFCSADPSRYGVFPGCATSEASCHDWIRHAQSSFLYVTDVDGDTTPDDLCKLYGYPYPVRPYYSYLYYTTNNILMGVGLECTGSTAVQPSTWGRVKNLFE